MRIKILDEATGEKLFTATSMSAARELAKLVRRTTGRRVRLVVALATLLSTSAGAGELRSAVIEFYSANNRVQSAVVFDACQHGDQLIESRTGRHRLRRSADRAKYDRVANKLGLAYQAEAEPTDANLEAIRQDFCRAADNR
jgi:hypothetical protein